MPLAIYKFITVKYGLDKHIQNIHVITCVHTYIHKCIMHSRNNYTILSRVLFLKVLAFTNLAMFIKIELCVDDINVMNFC